MMNKRELFENNNDNSRELKKLKMDLDYYKDMLKESEERWEIAKNDCEKYKKLSSQTNVYDSLYSSKVDDLNRYNDEKYEYMKIVLSIENLIKKYDNDPKLELGDYLSFPSDGGGYILTQIVKVGHSYMLMNVDTFKNQFDTLYTLSQIKDMVKNANDDVYPYYVDHEYKTLIGEEDFPTTSCKYLVYDKDCGGDSEVVITYDREKDEYNIMAAISDDYFYEESFDFAHEASIRLHQDYKIVKKLRD